ncbi:MAG: hypothetical protein DMG57_15900 [Acidobacteria bacterium]|nr:MAG: hypothetical protein DMG57_15900 [Acidobacteriota bacterium]
MKGSLMVLRKQGQMQQVRNEVPAVEVCLVSSMLLSRLATGIPQRHLQHRSVWRLAPGTGG